MKIFAIDTSHSVASCALCQDGTIIDYSEKNTNLSHSEAVLPLCTELLARNGLTFADIDLYAVNRGPGSFTGLRIGIAAAKGFAFMTEKPLMGVSSLMAVALASGIKGQVTAMVKARPGEWFYGVYDTAGPCPVLIGKEDAADMDHMENPADQLADTPSRADFVAQCAYFLHLAGEPCSVHGANPVYLKLSQAERMKLQQQELQ